MTRIRPSKQFDRRRYRTKFYIQQKASSDVREDYGIPEKGWKTLRCPDGTKKYLRGRAITLRGRQIEFARTFSTTATVRIESRYIPWLKENLYRLVHASTGDVYTIDHIENVELRGRDMVVTSTTFKKTGTNCQDPSPTNLEPCDTPKCKDGSNPYKD